MSERHTEQYFRSLFELFREDAQNVADAFEERSGRSFTDEELEAKAQEAYKLLCQMCGKTISNMLHSEREVETLKQLWPSCGASANDDAFLRKNVLILAEARDLVRENIYAHYKMTYPDKPLSKPDGNKDVQGFKDWCSNTAYDELLKAGYEHTEIAFFKNQLKPTTLTDVTERVLRDKRQSRT
jgi:hypothetical protein